MRRDELIRLFVAGITDDAGAAGAGSSGGNAGAAGAGANAGDGDGEGDSDADAGDGGDAGKAAKDPKAKAALSEDDKLKTENQNLRTQRKIFTKVTGFKDTKEAEDYEHKLKRAGVKSAKDAIDAYLAAAGDGTDNSGQGSTGHGKGDSSKPSASEELLRRQIQERDDEIRGLKDAATTTARKSVEDSAKGRLRTIAAEVGVKANRLDAAVRLLSDEFVRDVDGNLEHDEEGNFLIYRMSGAKRIADVLSADSLRLIVESTMKEFVETRGTGGSGGTQRGEGRGGAGSDPSKGLYTMSEDGTVKINMGEYNKLSEADKRKLQQDIAARATG